jgi:raffinose/stachyose/melibiose transport system permease protein
MFRYRRTTLVIEILMILAAVIMLLPFWLLLITAFKSGDEVLTTPAILPSSHPTLTNFTALFSDQTGQGNIFQALLSSVAITVGSILALVVLGSLAAYVFARSTRRWSTQAYYLFVVAIILPTQLGTLPLYIGAQRLGLVGTPWGMVLIYTGILLPLSVFLYAGFFRNLPRDYEEAASMDGATPFQVFRHVVFPLMSPATGSVAILAGLIVWNDFFSALIFLNGSKYQTLPVMTYNFVGALVSQWNLIFAVVIVSMIPILAFYVFAQKRFIQGYAGGLKS